MTLFPLVAAAFAAVFVVLYLTGHLLVARVGGVTPAPDGVAGRLPFDAPPVLLLGADSDTRAAATGPPGFRRLLVREDFLDRDDDLAAVAALAVGKLETGAFDVTVLAAAVRIELLLGLLAFLLRSARVDRSPAVGAAVVVAALLALYLLQRIVLWRVGAADDWAAARVGRDAVTVLLESRPERRSSRLLDLLRFQPSPARRLARFE